MDHRRRGGHGLRSGRRFFTDPQPAQAEHKPDFYPNGLFNTSSYPHAIISSYSHSGGYNNFCDVAGRANIYPLANEYRNSVNLLQPLPNDSSAPTAPCTFSLPPRVTDAVGAAEELRHRSGQGHKPWEIRARHGDIEDRIAPLPPAVREAALTAGRQHTLESAARAALDALATAARE